MTAADLNHIEARRRGAHAAIRRPDFDGEIALRWMDAEPRRIAHGERDHGGTGIDHEVDQAAIDPRLDQKMPARVARHDCRARARSRARGGRGRPRRQGCWPGRAPRGVGVATRQVAWDQGA